MADSGTDYTYMEIRTKNAKADRAMANNNTNIISIVIQALPAPPPPTSTTESSLFPSVSGTSRSIG
ncbi:hypothetical protein N7491_003074 [Penicillium cf. griseofulvum]|nr:hypothetical protein N7491_003074 [Penicillium cf. griseofulvum]